MRQLSSAGVLLAATLLGGDADPPSAPDAGLLRVQREVWEVWYAGDTARLRQLTPGVIAINPGGGTFADQEAVISGSARFHASGGRLLTLSFPSMRVQRFGDVAVVYSTYETVILAHGDTLHEHGRATEIFVRRHGAWVNPGWHLDAENPERK